MYAIPIISTSFFVLSIADLIPIHNRRIALFTGSYYAAHGSKIRQKIDNNTIEAWVCKDAMDDHFVHGGNKHLRKTYKFIQSSLTTPILDEGDS